MRHNGRSNYYVYALFRENGQPFYIGKGKGPRWTEHKSEAKAGKRGYRFNIIRGMISREFDFPRIKIHEGLTETVAYEYETALIRAIGRYPNGPLVNLTNGGEGTSGRIWTAEARAKMSRREISLETRAKMSQSARTKPPVTAETRARMSAASRNIPSESREKAAIAKRGRKHSLEWRENIRRALKGRPGKPATPETRAKMSAAQAGRVFSPEHRAKISKAKRFGEKPLTPAERMRRYQAKKRMTMV